MQVLKPKKDRYSPDNVFRIRINIGDHPGAKWVSFKDKETGEVTKGVFLPHGRFGGIRVRKGRVILNINAIPVQGFVNTHVLIPSISKGVDCGLGTIIGNKAVDYRKPVIGNMYVIGEVLSEDWRKIVGEYARRKGLRKIARYKKD